MQDNLTEKTVSLGELSSPEKVTKKADDEPLTALDSDKHGGSSTTNSVVEEPRFRVADSDEVDAAIAKRKDKIQPVLDYLKDK
ncbi:MAG: hypothetical protein OXH71_03045 [Candidatus Dadabacteria bacterium]|nr:hypothetical protein [Candidatus Dadabacteria bacterium]